jgi:predicted metalloprotease
MGGPPYGPPPGGPQFGQYGPQPWRPMYAPMPKKSNAGPIVAITLVAVMVAAAGAFGFLQKSRRNSTDDVGYSSPTTTYSTSTYDRTTERQTTATTSETTTTTATSSRDRTTTTTTPTKTTPAEPQPVYRLGDNPIFSTTNGVNAATCSLPAWRSDPATAEAYLNAALPCMEQAWQPAMARAGLPYRRPAIKSPAGTSWSTPCGSVTKGQAPAFYCYKDNTLYMPFAGLQTERYGNKTGAYLGILAHEFGHHVQHLTGILETYFEARYEAGDQTPAGLEQSRRLELEASCFAGMWFAGAQHGGGSMNDTIIRDALADGYQRGDWEGRIRDHGTPQHNGGWMEQGFKENRTYQCNTWVMDPQHVS